MLSTMQDFPLTISAIFRHGRAVFGESEVVTFEGESSRRASFAQVAERADRLASALARLGIREGDRVGTFAWNTQEHLEAYMAVPSMGAVLHTLNLRLFPEQLTYITNHAEDRIILVDATVIPLLARVAAELKTVEQFVVMGQGDTSGLGDNVISYEELLAAESGDPYPYPDLDERSAAAM
jgi:fatty-acyl-CoA synthase